MYFLIIVFILAIAALIFSIKKLEHFLVINNAPFKDKEKLVWDRCKNVDIIVGMLIDLKTKYPDTQYKELIEDLYKIHKK